MKRRVNGLPHYINVRNGLFQASISNVRISYFKSPYCGPRVLLHRLGIVGSNEEVKVPQSFDDYY